MTQFHKPAMRAIHHHYVFPHSGLFRIAALTHRRLADSASAFGFRIFALAVCFGSSVLAASLPTFNDFRHSDRGRRTTGQLQTTESLRITRVDPELIASTVKQHGNDPEILWGAAEFLVDWTQRKSMFASALAANGTNVAVALRFACAAAQHSDFEMAGQWLRYCKQNDTNNAAAWIADLWMLRQQQRPGNLANPPSARPGDFRDYSIEASRARIKLLEAASYSPYAARRLGFSPDSAVLSMARDLARPPVSDDAVALLQDAARAMQRHSTFLVTELVGQTIDRNLLAQQKDAATNEQTRFRVDQMDTRREELKGLVADIERDTIDLATEPQMVKYYDNVLSLGEESAMRRLAEAVRHGP